MTVFRLIIGAKDLAAVRAMVEKLVDWDVPGAQKREYVAKNLPEVVSVLGEYLFRALLNIILAKLQAGASKP
jgi:hypothetical protein